MKRRQFLTSCMGVAALAATPLPAIASEGSDVIRASEINSRGLRVVRGKTVIMDERIMIHGSLHLDGCLVKPSREGAWEQEAVWHKGCIVPSESGYAVFDAPVKRTPLKCTDTYFDGCVLLPLGNVRMTGDPITETHHLKVIRFKDASA